MVDMDYEADKLKAVWEERHRQRVINRRLGAFMAIWALPIIVTGAVWHDTTITCCGLSLLAIGGWGYLVSR